MNVFQLPVLEKKLKSFVSKGLYRITLFVAILCLMSYSTEGKSFLPHTYGLGPSLMNARSMESDLVKNVVLICAPSINEYGWSTVNGDRNSLSSPTFSGPGAPSIISVEEDNTMLKIRFKTPATGITLGTIYQASIDGGITWKNIETKVNYLNPSNLSGTEAELTVFLGQNFPITVKLRAVNNDIAGDSSNGFLFKKSPKASLTY